MKLLILFSNLHEAKLMIEWLKKGTAFDSSLKSLFTQSPQSLYSYIQSEIEIELVITGDTMMDTSFQLGRILTTKKYHLVLQVGLCSAYDESLSIGDLVSVINDKSGDVGIMQQGTFANAYDSNLYKLDEYPHNRSGFINLTNAYFNVFLEIRKVASITVNTQNRGSDNLASRRKDFNIHIESSNGLGCVYACLYQKQPFYQLRTVSYLQTTHEEDIERAIQKMTENVIDLIMKIS